MWTTDGEREFLTTCCAHSTPDQSSPPVVGTRRVPGFRRSEVAQTGRTARQYYAASRRPFRSRILQRPRRVLCPIVTGPLTRSWSVATEQQRGAPISSLTGGCPSLIYLSTAAQPDPVADAYTQVDLRRAANAFRVLGPPRPR
jgi:hypothetical protein